MDAEDWGSCIAAVAVIGFWLLMLGIILHFASKYW